LGNYDKSKIVSRLLAPESADHGVKVKCMVGKFILGQASEAACQSTAEKIADLALSADFRLRVEGLKACLQPQLFACKCRLLVDKLMSLLPLPQSVEDSYGSEHLANFHDLLWRFVLVPLLMNDRNHCANLFVRLFTLREYSSSAGLDISEMRIKEVVESMDSNLFFIKGQEFRGLAPDDHFDTVSQLIYIKIYA
jgi:hypothetical protein